MKLQSFTLFWVFLSFSVSTGLVATTGDENKTADCPRLFKLQSQLLFVLTEEGQGVVDAVIEDIGQLNDRDTMTGIYSIHTKLLPVLVRTGLRWSEIVALATPHGYEMTVSRCHVLGTLFEDSLSFLTYMLKNNTQFVGMTSRQVAIAFLREFKERFSRSRE